MNEFVVTIEYFPKVFGKDELFRVKTDMSKKELWDKMRDKAMSEDMYDVSVFVETIEEYIGSIKLKEVN